MELDETFYSSNKLVSLSPNYYSFVFYCLFTLKGESSGYLLKILKTLLLLKLDFWERNSAYRDVLRGSVEDKGNACLGDTCNETVLISYGSLFNLSKLSGYSPW